MSEANQTLAELISSLGFNVKGIEVNGFSTGSHIRHNNFSFDEFEDEVKYVSQTDKNLTDKKCIKIYVKFRENEVNEGIFETIKSLAELIRNNEIAAKYDENGHFLVHFDPSDYSDYRVRQITGGVSELFEGYHVCIYVPYSKIDTLKTVIEKITTLPHKEIKILIGKTLFHRYVPLKEEDLEKIIKHYDKHVQDSSNKLNTSLKTKEEILKRLETYKEKIENETLNKESINTVPFLPILTEQIFGKPYAEALLEIEKTNGIYKITYYPTLSQEEKERKKLEKEISKEELKGHIMKSIRKCKEDISKYKKEINQLNNYLSLIENKNYIKALEMLKELGILKDRYAETLKIEGNHTYLSGAGVDAFVDRILLEEKRIAVNGVNITVSYIPSEKSKANEIINAITRR